MNPSSGARYRLTFPAAILAAALILTGCTTSNTPMRDWLASNGGIATDRTHQHRAEHALARLLRTPPVRPLAVAVLDSDQLGAFSWPSGHVFVTRALIDHVSDDELTAAIAHELGHLLPAPRTAAVTSLKGHPAAFETELRADHLARQLLADANLPPAALRTLLQKLAADDRLSPAKRHDLHLRAQRLSPPTPR
jgi:Zn-dependent protease with chaperone function